jgi:hypothetical protein
MRPTVGQNDRNVEHIEWLSREQGTLGGDGLCFVEVFQLVIQQILLFVSLSLPAIVSFTHIVPVGRSHLQTSRAPLWVVTGPVAHDVCEGMASFPMTGPNTLVPFHRIRLREIVP